MRTTKTRLASATVVLVLLLGGWFYYRWGNYWHKPLFFNTYSANRDRIGPWRWQFRPAPIFDGHGRLLLFDFDANMIAVVLLESPDERTIGIGDISPNTFELFVGPQSVNISKATNSVVATKSAAPLQTHPLRPGESKLLFDTIRTKLESGDPDVKLTIDHLIGS